MAAAMMPAPLGGSARPTRAGLAGVGYGFLRHADGADLAEGDQLSHPRYDLVTGGQEHRVTTHTQGVLDERRSDRGPESAPAGGGQGGDADHLAHAVPRIVAADRKHAVPPVHRNDEDP